MPNLATSGRWLKHIEDGTIYPWNPHLAGNASVEEVPEEMAFPERFLPATQKGRTAKVDLGTDEAVVEGAKKPKVTKAGLAADAGRGLK